MSKRGHCSQCGAPLLADVREAICPLCEFRGALNVDDGDQPFVAPDPGLSEPHPLTPSLSPSGGEGARRAGEGDSESPGRRSIGDYELLEEIARGGMGVVFKARQRSLNRLVALKLLPAGTLAKPEAVKRFQAEASAAAALQHPNIVAIHEIGVQGDQHFIAMALVEGPSLARVISDSRFTIHDFRRAARWVKSIAEAVHYAHERGILHRDLKPSNILLGADDQPHVTDFGLAKRLSNAELETRSAELTLSGQVLGSPNYMPPEQATAHRGKANRRSDVYGLGATLYHLLTGRAPFQGASLTEVLQQVAHADPLAPRLLQPGVPPDLETICLKCLEKEPAKRYATAQALADDLNRFLHDEPIHARPVGRVEKAWRWCRRKPALAGALVALALAVTLGLAGILTQWQRAEHQRARAKLQSQRAEDNAANERRERYYASITAADSHIRNGDIDVALNVLTNCPPELWHWEWGRLMYLCHQNATTVRLTTNNAESLIVSPDGTRAASARFLFGGSGESVCWDVATGGEVFRFGSATNKVVAMTFSPDGTQIAVARQSGQVKICDAAKGHERVEFNATNEIYALQFGGDGTRLTLTTSDSRCSIWETQSGRMLESTPSLQVSPAASALDPTGRFWVTLENTDTLTLRDARTTAPRFTMQGHKDVNLTTASKGATLLFSPDGRHLLAYASAQVVKVWSTETGRELLINPSRVYGAAFSPDGRLVATISGNKTAEIWDLVTGQRTQTAKGHEAPINFVGFDRDGRRLFTTDSKGVLKTWSVHPGRELLHHTYAVDHLDFSPDGRYLITTQMDGLARIWDTVSGNERLVFRGNWNWLRVAKFSPDGRRIVTGGADRLARIFETDTGRELMVLKGHASAVRTAAFSPDGMKVATGGWDKSARIWDATNGKELFTLTAHRGGVRVVAFLPSGDRLVTAAHDSDAHVWEIETGRHLFALAGDSFGLSALNVSPDGQYIATGNLGRSICIWDAHSGQLLRRWQTRSAVMDVAFSPDGKRLAVVSSDAIGMFASPTVEIWDVETGRQTLAIQDHSSLVMSAKFSPDGRQLASACVDGTVRVRETFPWEKSSYPGLPADPLHSRAGDHARLYWRDRLAAETLSGARKNPRNGIGAPRFPLSAWPPRDRGLSANRIDLSSHYNALLNVPWRLVEHESKYDNDLSSLPVGSISFSNIVFDVRGLIRLRAANSFVVDLETNSFPVAATEIRVGAKCRRFHLLHGAETTVAEDAAICHYVLNYANGDRHEIPIRYGRDVRHWWQLDEDIRESDRGAVVWRGSNPAVKNFGGRLRLYLSTFENPRPEEEIQTIDFVSALTRSAPFLLALTIEP